ncbi:MAG: hypothetical protein ACRC2T_10425 [Thermoguttaceae bacterium]
MKSKLFYSVLIICTGGLIAFFSQFSHLHNSVTAQQSRGTNAASSEQLPERYWAENWIQFSFSPNRTMFETEMDTTPFELFVNTQIALMKSPMVLKTVVENPTISRLPSIQRTVDPMKWISSKLTVENSLGANKKSEIYVVSFDSIDPKEAEMIVNAVVDAYVSYYQINLMKQEQILCKSLLESKEQHEAVVRKLNTQLPQNLDDQNALDAQTTILISQINREMRIIDQLTDRLTEIESTRGSASRVSILQRASSTQMQQNIGE